MRRDTAVWNRMLREVTENTPFDAVAECRVPALLH
jgi:hypothetical protein